MVFVGEAFSPDVGGWRAAVTEKETQPPPMIVIEPRIRSNICITAHPQGCAAQVRVQIHYVRSRGALAGPQRVLVIGASNGYGLAARIVSAFGSGAATIGVAYERPGAPNRSATAGWYNSAAFIQEAAKAGLQAWNINGDAFTEEIKSETIERIKSDLGGVDFVVYSIAAPRRIDPATGEIYASVVKPIGAPFSARGIDFLTGRVTSMTAEPATEDEAAHTVKVMGGEDWELWVQRLLREGLLAPGARTIALSYIGPELTRAIYRDGTIGRAKADLEATAKRLDALLKRVDGRALISVNKALVTRASAIIPGVSLYISLLYKAMKERGLHEGCIHQMDRLYRDFLFSGKDLPTDDEGRIRLDEWEMRPDVQQSVKESWEKITSKTLSRHADIGGFRDEFLRHHGFGMPGIDYARPVDPTKIGPE
jgi:enoyl-[acyl-carrier protein] reductase/trans-2-enoyl-CoA reductase (NAD+)